MHTAPALITNSTDMSRNNLSGTFTTWENTKVNEVKLIHWVFCALLN